MAAAPAGKPTGKVGAAVSAARTLTDQNATAAEKATEGAALAAQAVGTAAGGTVVGVVAGQAVRSKGGRKVLAALGVLLVLLIVGAAATVAMAVQAASAILLEEDQEQNGGDGACVPGGIGLPIGGASGLSAEQQANATAILGEVQRRGLGAGDAVIAVMTALAESSLVNVPHGDLAGPDSRGLFQQRDSWGPLEVRMDPAGATGLFLDRLVAPGLMQYEGFKVPKTVSINSDGAVSRGTYPPWRVAQSVQISYADGGENYRARYAHAVQIVSQMLGEHVYVDARVATWAGQLGPTDPRVDLTGVDGDADTPVPSTPAEGCQPTAPPADGPGPGAWGGHSNGQIAAEHLCGLSWETPDLLLRCDAAAQLEKLNAQFYADLGRNLDVGQAYRSLEQQNCLYYGPCSRSGPAAKPGTSNHGWGLAIDINGTAAGDGSYEARKGTIVYKWMALNAPTYLFRENVSLREAWHWEYHGGWDG